MFPHLPTDAFSQEKNKKKTICFTDMSLTLHNSQISKTVRAWEYQCVHSRLPDSDTDVWGTSCECEPESGGI